MTEETSSCSMRRAGEEGTYAAAHAAVAGQLLDVRGAGVRRAALFNARDNAPAERARRSVFPWWATAR